MVVFSDLRVTNDASTLIIDVYIDTSQDNDVDQQIQEIWVDTSVPEYSEGCPERTSTAVLVAKHSEPARSLEAEPSEDPDPITINNPTQVRLELSYNEWGKYFDFTKEMCHVYVVTSGTGPAPCKCSTPIATVVHLYPYYQLSIYYMRDMKNECSPHKDLIDLILKLKSIEYSIKVGNYSMAHYMWNLLAKSKPVIQKCGCGHGVLY